MQAVDTFGPQDWNRIAKHVANKNHIHCRNRLVIIIFSFINVFMFIIYFRWINGLDPKRRNAPWLWEELQRLIFGMRIFGRRELTFFLFCFPTFYDLIYHCRLSGEDGLASTWSQQSRCQKSTPFFDVVQNSGAFIFGLYCSLLLFLIICF